MTDLTKQLEEALKFDRWAGMKTDYVDGRIFENARLAPFHAALLKCVEALEFSVKRCAEAFEKNQNSTCLARGMTHGTYVSLSFALADLRKALEECK